MNKIKNVSMIALFVLALLAVSGIASATMTINTVKVDGTSFDKDADCATDGDCVMTLGVLKDNVLEVKVTATSTVAEEDVQLSAYIRGNRKDLVEDTTDTFDMKPGVSYVKTLKLNLPSRMTQNTYTLFVRVENNEGQLQQEMQFSLEIDATDNAMTIKDIVLSPENYVKAGRALLTTVRLKNLGEMDQEDIKVKVSMPELGISASDYIDSLDAECNDSDIDCDDSTTSEELYLRIPDCAEEGEYTVKVCVQYDDGDEEECKTTSIQVTEGDLCPSTAPVTPSTGAESKTIITIGPETQAVTVGQNAVYSVTITNQGTETKTYSVLAEAGNWAEVSITPTNVLVLSPGESKSAFINVAPSADGQQMFSVTIKSGDKVLKQVPLKADVTKAAASGLSSIKRGLEIGLIILVVLLVILGLIIGFNKLRNNEEETKEEQTYY